MTKFDPSSSVHDTLKEVDKSTQRRLKVKRRLERMLGNGPPGKIGQAIANFCAYGIIIFFVVVFFGGGLWIIINSSKGDVPNIKEPSSDAQRRGFTVDSAKANDDPYGVLIDTKVGSSCNGKLIYSSDGVKLEVSIPDSSHPIIYNNDEVNMGKLRHDPVVAKCFAE